MNMSLNTFSNVKSSPPPVLQVVQFHASPAKLRLAVDGHQSTPRELTFQSARVRGQRSSPAPDRSVVQLTFRGQI